MLELTDDFGMRVESSGSGSQEGLTFDKRAFQRPRACTIERVEFVGQNLKGATIHIFSGPEDYPLIVIDDITDGRLVATAEAYVQPGLVEPWLNPVFGDFEMEGRAVLLDAQDLRASSQLGVFGRRQRY